MTDEESSYDEDITIFSPQGRLYQVEYARETVRKGATTIGIKFDDGIMFIALKNEFSKTVEFISIEKIFKIDNHIACTYCGLSADARQLIDYLIEEIQINKIWYDEEITIKILVENLCAYINLFSRYQSVRPFGVVMFIGGIDSKGSCLFTTDPSGSFIEYSAICEGMKNETVTEYLEKNYKKNMSVEKAIMLGLNAVKKATSKKITPEKLEIGIIEKNKSFKKLNQDEIKKHLKG
ncbi:MAG: archaeal proteasome endopeptidase complex subunit alpha [Candidatus Thermoplasmatota archaeon]|nr:archaeal proteasome endopeptidase complex subunit alpha [Candidatus Thermoplasmatota archaeon]